MGIYNFTKTINSDKLKVEITQSALPAPQMINTSGVSVDIIFSNDLTSEQQTTLTSVVANHVALTTAESLSIYLDTQIYPFVQNLIRTFAAENISLGITQAGKTGHVLALFTKKYPIPDANFQNSLKDSFDTGSLYISRELIQYIRDNSGEYSGLSPFVTDARLLSMKNKIETILGLPLST